MKKVGAVTIGQSPRVDVIPGIMPILGEDIVITPDEQQVQQAYEQWEPIMKEVTPITANPYGDMSGGGGGPHKSKCTCRRFLLSWIASDLRKRRKI